jgi:hypothetical protein
MPKQPIFRDKALKQHIQSREKTILPRFVAPPVFAFYWVMLAILLVAVTIAWFEQVPLYAAGAGLIPAPNATTNQGSNQNIAIVFLAASASLHPQPGLPARLQVGSSGPQLEGTVDSVEPGVLSPAAVQKQYALVLPQPVVVVIVKLKTTVPGSAYAGSLVSAQVQVGSQRLLSLFPGLNTLLKGS